jgi:hypothetical protein
MHITDGELRLWFEKQPGDLAAPAVEQHIRFCVRCRERLELLSDYARKVSARLDSLGEGESSIMSTDEAARRLKDRLKTDQEKPAWWNRVFALRYRTAWISAGMTAGLALALLFPSVQVLAGRFLSIFRLKQFSVVRVDPENMQKLERLGSSSLLAQMLSDTVKVDSKAQPQEAANTAEASLLARMQLRVPAAFAEPPRWSVQPEVNVTLSMDLPRIKTILEEAGYADILLPENLQGSEIAINIPPRAVGSYGDCGQARTQDTSGTFQTSLSPQRSCTTLMQLMTPTVTVPQGLDIDRLGLALLRLLGVPAEEAARFSKNVDWTSTFVIPIPQNAASFEEIEVRGVEGILIQTDSARTGRLQRYLLIWTEGGIVCALNGTGSKLDALTIANSLQ